MDLPKQTVPLHVVLSAEIYYDIICVIIIKSQTVVLIGGYSVSDFRSGRGGRNTGRTANTRPAAPAPHSKAPQGGPQVRPLWFLVVTDILLLGVALNVFALFHHIIPHALDPNDIEKLPVNTPIVATVKPTQSPVLTANTTATATPSTVATDQPTATPQPADLGMWGEKFADKFSGGDVVKTDSSYQSHDINVTVTKNDYQGATYFVADIYVRNLQNFMSGLANDKVGVGQRETTLSQAKRHNAIIAINGDNYGNRYDGVVVRNGTLDRSKVYKDVLVMNNDGTMAAFSPKAFDINSIKTNGAWQVWNFGPNLLDADGQPLTSFDYPDIGGANPRTAIGYYEPGHYSLVLVDGRSASSNGLKLPDLAELMNNLGCKLAYNLDGGRTSVMAFMGKVINSPYEGGRSTSDTVFVSESN
jgi:exopolysaccharide biosynthesis protein